MPMCILRILGNSTSFNIVADRKVLMDKSAPLKQDNLQSSSSKEDN